MSYRRSFAAETTAAHYEASHLGHNPYVRILWALEQEHLAHIVEDFRRHAIGRIDYLDFASGTGRILSFMEDKVDTATGIEISQAMVTHSISKLRDAKVICTDITEPGAPIEAKYDIITAFRFVLNAEPDLRLAAMRALAARLKDNNSLLIFNNHGNRWSHLRLWKRPFDWFHKPRNYMSNREARDLARAAGLKIEHTVGFGVLSSHVARLFSPERAVAIERALSRSVFSRFAANQTYTARLA